MVLEDVVTTRGSSSRSKPDLGVKVEAQFEVGEYDVVRDVRASGLPGAVRDRPSVPDQRPVRMRDQESSHRQIACCNLYCLELEASQIGNMDRAAVEHIQPDGLRQECTISRAHGRPCFA